MSKFFIFGVGFSAAAGSVLGSMLQRGNLDITVVMSFACAGGFVTVLGASALRTVFKKWRG